uniref:Cytochrome P450 n=1 Tax=Oryza barthii TaxID=65489 RepID=A0A0D3G925_9ORYZ
MSKFQILTRARWRQNFAGETYLYWLRRRPALYVTDPELIGEIGRCVSLDMGKPKYLQKGQEPLFGGGVLKANGACWARQRKVIAPEFYMARVRAMVQLMVDAAQPLIASWESRIDAAGGAAAAAAEVVVDGDLRSFSFDVISRACFGSDYSRGREIFLRLRELSGLMSETSVIFSIPSLRHLPTGKNRRIWRLTGEIRSLIMELDRARAEVLEVCGGDGAAAAAAPDFDMVSRMRTVGMVVQETLRLFPPSSFVVRETFRDMQLGRLLAPKGTYLFVPVSTMHHDVAAWGPTARLFDPSRFRDGVAAACKHPQASFMPFGLSARTCLGQNLALVEVKTLVAVVLARFEFTLSPEYRHSPAFRLIIEPEFGLRLCIRRAGGQDATSQADTSTAPVHSSHN